MQVEAEDDQQHSGHHKAAAADKLKEVDASTWQAKHDGLDANETDEGQDLQQKTWTLLGNNVIWVKVVISNNVLCSCCLIHGSLATIFYSVQ